jgi:hypothetical protein
MLADSRVFLGTRKHMPQIEESAFAAQSWQISPLVADRFTS